MDRLENMTATEILLRNKQNYETLSRTLGAVMKPLVDDMFDQMVRHGCATTYMAPLTWQEKVLTWNPCNDHVNQLGDYAIRIVTPQEMHKWTD